MKNICNADDSLLDYAEVIVRDFLRTLLDTREGDVGGWEERDNACGRARNTGDQLNKKMTGQVNLCQSLSSNSRQGLGEDTRRCMTQITLPLACDYIVLS